jgi:hypothetical protein
MQENPTSTDETTVAKDISLEDREDENLLSRGQSAFYIVIGISIIALFAYLIQFGKLGWSPKQEVWGQFGDFFGGLLNPTMGLVTIYLVLANVRLQRKELKNSLQELRNSNKALLQQNRLAESQAFEQSFFTWLNSYQNIVSSVAHTTGQGNKAVGREALLEAYASRFNHEEISLIVSQHASLRGDALNAFLRSGDLDPSFQPKIKEALDHVWVSLYQETRHDIGAMFRTLFRLLTWIDSRPITLLSCDQKWDYVAIVRAQISDIELVYLFFNGLTLTGKKFAYLINKYALFDNLDVENHFLLSFYSRVNGAPFEKRAYNSALARLAIAQDDTQNHDIAK